MTRLQNMVRAAARHIIRADAVMPIVLRPARSEDFAFCVRLYLSAMANIIRDLNLDVTRQEENLRHLWEADQVQIVTLDGCDVGWIQIAVQDSTLHLEQIFVDAPFRGRGIGTRLITDLIDQATRARQPMALAVVRSNRALQLSERLGFHIIDEDDRKFYMKRERDDARRA